MRRNPGKQLRLALQEETPLKMVGVINAYVAIMAKAIGFKALYLSGAGVANASYGLPDSGITTRDNVLEDLRRITSAVDLPLLVDIDTGWGNEQSIARTIQEMIQSGAAGVHIEDQLSNKKCGHLPNKKLVSKEEMVVRIRAAIEAKTDPNFVIMARTDALASEGLKGTIERAVAYKEAGAEMFFAEAMPEIEHYRMIKKAINIPILANMTEFGKTPLTETEELAKVGVDIALYPLSAMRVMNQAALKLLKDIQENGTQIASLDQMQTREELYKFLKYHP